MELIKNFFIENFATYGVWLLVTYATVIIAMAADLVTGLAKSRRNGVKCNSRGLKRTCDKAMKYFMPMICLTCIDLLGSVIENAPYLTMLFAGYCSFCELKSVMETTHQKAEINRIANIGELLSGLDEPTLKSLIKTIIEDSRHQTPPSKAE